MSTFTTLYTKIPQDKLLHVLKEINDFDFKSGARDYVTIYSSGAYWSREKSNA